MSGQNYMKKWSHALEVHTFSTSFSQPYTMKYLLLLGTGLTHVLGNAKSAGADSLCIFPQSLAHSSICTIRDAVEPLTTTRDRVLSNSSALSTSSLWTGVSRCFREGLESPEFCIYIKEDYGGKGIAVITEAETASHIVNSQGFTEPSYLQGTNQILGKIKVAAIPGKEYGLVATERIARGEVILKETASLLVDYAALESMPRNQLDIMRAHAVGLLNYHHRDQVMNLSTHGYHGDEVSTVAAIAKNNMFSISTNSSRTDDRFYALFAQSKFPLGPFGFHVVLLPSNTKNISSFSLESRLPPQYRLLVRSSDTDTANNRSSRHLPRRRAHNQLC